MQPVIDWFKNKSNIPSAWYVQRNEIDGSNYSLDFRNPERPDRTQEAFLALSNSIQSAITSTSNRIKDLISSSAQIELLASSTWDRVALGDVLVRVRLEATVADEEFYKQITVRLYGKGVIERGVQKGRDIKTRPQFLAHRGDLIMSRIDARNGAFGIISDQLEGALVTQDFPMFRIDPQRIVPNYLALLLKSDEFTAICKRASRGTTNRKRLKEELLLAEEIPLPPIDVQRQLLQFASGASEAASNARAVAEAAERIERNVCNLMLHI